MTEKNPDSGEFETVQYQPLLPDLCKGDALFSVVIIAELMAILITVAGSGLMTFDWLLLSKASMAALWITLVSALILCFFREKINSFPRSQAAAICYGIILVISLFFGLAAELALHWFLSAGGNRLFDPWRTVDYLILTAIPAGVLLRYLYLQQQLRVREQSELDARIQALQSRIRPHFLFNSMNVIASLISTDPEKAEQAVEDISDLFRGSLTNADTLVPLREELSLCRRYLALEKLRLGDRLQTTWDIGDYGEGVMIPPLTLQPLLENAIYHGIQLLPEGGEVSVSLTRQGDSVRIVVSNPLIRVLQQKKGNRMAIQNIRHRLDAHFGNRASIDASPGEDVFVTTIELPAG
ncbi:MAG: sensor histidine kinase [bacterium]